MHSVVEEEVHWIPFVMSVVVVVVDAADAVVVVAVVVVVVAVVVVAAAAAAAEESLMASASYKKAQMVDSAELLKHNIVAVVPVGAADGVVDAAVDCLINYHSLHLQLQTKNVQFVHYLVEPLTLIALAA